MKIIVVGAGEIGFHLTRRLSADNDITLIESDPLRARRASEQLDAFVLEGNGTSYQLLKKANIHKADVVAAVSNNDEVNLLICQIAKRVGVETTIARVRNSEYTEPDFIIARNELGADLVIHPEKVTADAIRRLIRQSAATDVLEFADGKIQLMGIRLEEESSLLRVPLKDLDEAFLGLPMRIAVIHRKEQTIIPKGNDVLVRGDQVFFIVDPAYAHELTAMAGKTETKIGDVMVLGGGLIGQFIARDLNKDVHVKIVESNVERSQKIADNLPNCLVIHGDGTDVDLLAVEGLMDMDAFVAVTGSDETNIISTLVARHLNVPRTIALVNNMDYMPITPTIGMDAVVSKQLMTVNEVHRYIRHKRVTSIATIPGVDAQIVEYIATPRSKITRKPLRDFNFPRNALIGAVFQGKKAIIPKGDTQIEPGDRVVVISLPQATNDVERLFG